MKDRAFIIIWGEKDFYTLSYPESGAVIWFDLMSYFEKYLHDKTLPFDAAWAEKMLMKTDRFFRRKRRLDRCTRFIYELDTVDREVRGYKRYFDGSRKKMDFTKGWDDIRSTPKDMLLRLKEE